MDADDFIFQNIVPLPWIDRGNELSIGSDPEVAFRCKKQGHQINAPNIVPNEDEIIIGVDGHSHIAEFRPPYGWNPFQHLANLKRCMFIVEKLVRSYEDFSGNLVETIAGSLLGEDKLGGHIHLGSTDNSHLTTVLDFYLMPILAALDHPKEFGERVRGFQNDNPRFKYGRFRDVRARSYGMEYRPPQSWLVSESIARGILVSAWILTAYQDNIHTIPAHPEFRESHYTRHDYRMLRLAALNSLDTILSHAALHGRHAFLSVATLKGLIKQKKRWHKGDIFSRWNLERESIAPPILTVHPIDDFCLKELLRKHRVEYLAFPLHFEHHHNPNEENIEVIIDPAISTAVTEELVREAMNNRYSQEYNTQFNFTIDSARGGVMVFVPEDMPSFLLEYVWGLFGGLFEFADVSSPVLRL